MANDVLVRSKIAIISLFQRRDVVQNDYLFWLTHSLTRTRARARVRRSSLAKSALAKSAAKDAASGAVQCSTVLLLLLLHISRDL